MNEVPSRNRPAQGWKRDVIVVLVLWASAYALYLRSSAHLLPVVSARNDVVFGADTEDSLSAMKRLNLDWEQTDEVKHPIYPYLARAAVFVAERGIGRRGSRAIGLIIALFASLNVVVAYLVLRASRCGAPLAAIAAAVLGLAFSPLVILSIPETYSLSNLAIGLYMIALARCLGRATTGRLIGLGGLAGFAALCNPPLLALVVASSVAFGLAHGLRAGCRAFALSAGVGGAVFAGVVAMRFGPAYLHFASGYSSTWASLRNLGRIDLAADVLASFFLFSFVSPGATIGKSYVAGQCAQLLASGTGRILTLALVGGYSLALFALWRRRSPLHVGLAAWAALMVVFYVYFNPAEAILYSSQVVLPSIVLMASAAGDEKISPAALLLVAALALILATHNLPTVWSTK